MIFVVSQIFFFFKINFKKIFQNYNKTVLMVFPREQSDLGPYCLQYRLINNISRSIREQKLTDSFFSSSKKVNFNFLKKILRTSADL